MPNLRYCSDGDIISGPMGEYTLNKLVLEQIHFAKTFTLKGHALQHLNLADVTDRDVLVDQVRRSLYELETYILAEKLAHDVVPVYFSHPTTWWDAFKLRFFSQWLLNKYPPDYTVVEKRVDFKQYALYPSINDVFPDYPKENIIVQSMTAVKGGQEYVE